MNLRPLGLVSTILLLGSCILSPLSNTTAQAGRAGTTIFFDGIADPQPNITVTVEYQQQRGGWIAVGSSPLPAFGSWHVTAQVPDSAFWKAPCGFATFRVMASNGQQYVGTDQECQDAPIPDPNNSCFTNEILVQHPQAHVGDLNLLTQADADLYRCVTELDGNLSITGQGIQTSPGVFSPGVTVYLPRLETITGSLTIDGGQSEAISLPRLTSTGGDLSVSLNRFTTDPNTLNGFLITRLDASRLASVGGGVMLQDANQGLNSGSTAKTYAFGLDAVTSVGGAITVHNTAFPALMTGLNGLTSIPGDLLFDMGTSDLNSQDLANTPQVEGLLNALVTVGGNATLILPPNANVALARLGHVAGSLSLQPTGNHTTLRPTLMPLLHDVGGDMTLDSVQVTSCNVAANHFSSLQTVTGALRFQGDSAFKRSLGADGPDHLTVGSLEMTGTSTGRIPLYSTARIAGTGGAMFQDNANLCPCLVDSFTTALAATGWTGTATNSGNGTAALCAPCPAPVSCP